MSIVKASIQVWGEREEFEIMSCKLIEMNGKVIFPKVHSGLTATVVALRENNLINV